MQILWYELLFACILFIFFKVTSFYVIVIINFFQSDFFLCLLWLFIFYEVTSFYIFVIIHFARGYIFEEI